MRINRPLPFLGPGGPFHRMGFIFGPGPGGRGGPFVAFLFLLFVAVVVVVVVALIRYEMMRRRGGIAGHSGSGANEALRILNERFAKGDIDAEDYKVRRDLLSGPA